MAFRKESLILILLTMSFGCANTALYSEKYKHGEKYSYYCHIPRSELECDNLFWRVVHERNISTLPIKIYQSHIPRPKHWQDHDELFRILSVSENKRNLSTEFLHVFYNIGKDISGFSNLDEPLFEEYLKHRSHIFYSGKDHPAGEHEYTSYSRLYAILKNKNLPMSVLTKALKDQVYKNDYSVYLSIARNPNAEIQSYLSSLRDSLCQNFRNFADVERIFLVSQRTLARYSNKQEVLRKLSEEEDEETLKELTRNRSTPYDVLDALSNHKDRRLAYKAQIAIYESSNTPSQMLREAYKMGDRRVVESIAENPNLPDDLVDKIFKEGNSLVRQRLIVGLANRPSPDLDKINRFVWQMSKEKFYPPHFPPIANRVIGIELEEVGNFVYYLENTTLTDEELKELLNNISYKLKVKLIEYEQTDYHVLELLAEDDNNDVAISAKGLVAEINSITRGSL